MSLLRTILGSAAAILRSLRTSVADRSVIPPPVSTDTLLPVLPDHDTLSHLASLLDSVTAAVISLDGEGRIRVFNAAAESLFALHRARVVGRPFGEVGRISTFEDQAMRALWERLTDAVWAAGAALELEYDFYPKLGPRRVISYSVYPLGRMAWSVGNGVVIVCEDITRKKEMEDQVSDARKKLLAVFDGITDGIQVVDSAYRVTAVNKSMTSLLSRTIKLGDHCYAACAFDLKICPDCPAEETFLTGQPASTTKRLAFTRDANGSDERDRYIEINTFPLLDRGNRVVQVVEYIKDVSDKMRLADRLEHARRLAELGEMAARVAHEVRNPLNAITGAAHFLAEEYAGDETLQKFISLIKRQAVRVNQVASDLLYVSKPLRTRLTTLNINAVFDQALDALCEQLKDQHISVVHDMSPIMPLIEADELQIEQVLHNLLRNAVEAMPEGGTLWLGTAVGAGGAEISIQDTGPGIPAEDRDRIFQSFYTTKIKGTGLGLTIVQRVLKNHGGEILVQQPEAGGTRVVVRLPLSAGTEVEGSVNGRSGDSGEPERQGVNHGA